VRHRCGSQWKKQKNRRDSQSVCSFASSSSFSFQLLPLLMYAHSLPPLMPVHDMQVNNPHSPTRRRSTPNVKMKLRRESEREPLETHRELAIKLILLLIGEQPRRRSSHERNRASERERETRLLVPFSPILDLTFAASSQPPLPSPPPGHDRHEVHGKCTQRKPSMRNSHEAVSYACRRGSHSGMVPIVVLF